MRRDGKKVKCTDVEYAIVPHIMVDRNDSLNMIELDIPLQPMHDYLNEKRKDGIKLSHLAIIIAALLIGSSLVMLIDVGPRFYEMPVLGFVGFTISLALGVFTVVRYFIEF